MTTHMGRILEPGGYIPATDEAWESGQLGGDIKFAKRAITDEQTEKKIDEVLGPLVIAKNGFRCDPRRH